MPKGSFFRRSGAVFKNPLAAALLTAALGVAATLFSKWLDSTSKDRELQLAATQRATDSVKTVTDLIFERAFRANMLVSSIRRHSTIEELKERKKEYDAVFVRYNSTIQSNLFRIQEMFEGGDYKVFQHLMEGRLRALLVAQDECITKAYDDASSSDENNKLRGQEDLESCTTSAGGPVKMRLVYDAIQQCEYSYSDALFRAVKLSNEERVNLSKFAEDVNDACVFPETSANVENGKEAKAPQTSTKP